jgi:hypothetical protein
MKCPDFERLMLFLDGELTGDELHSIEEHLDSCTRCRRLIESQRMLENSWRDDFTFPATMEFRRREDQLFRRIHRRSRWRTLVPAAAGIIAALLGIKLMMNARPSIDRVSFIARSMNEGRTVEDVETPGRGLVDLPPEELTQEESCFETMSDSMHRLGMTECIGQTTGMDSPSTQVWAEAGEGSSRSAAMDRVDELTEEAPDASLERVSAGMVAGGCTGDVTISAEQPVTVETISAGESEDGSAGLADSGVQDYRTIENQINLDADYTGLHCAETISSTGAGEQDDLESRYAEIKTETGEEEEDQQEQAGVCFCPSYDSCCGLVEEITVCLVFDSLGMPDSSTAALLDSLSPGWRDYIQYEFKDTVMVVPLADVNGLVLHGGSLPAEQME